ncbi:MAG: DUF1178 family protein, partial [Hyphomicrobiaceae bacterium]
ALACPHCGSKKVSKALMAPGVATSRSASKRRRAGAEELVPVSPQAVPKPVDQRTAMQRQFLTLMRQVRAEVEKNAEYVGPKFADEARKIHLNEAEARGIWGEATLEEAQELSEEGIDCLPLPPLPEDKN